MNWKEMMARPVPELAFEHNIGHPHAPDAIYGNHRLFLWMDGRLRLEHRKGRSEKFWTARIDPRYFARVMELLQQVGFPDIPVERLPAGPSFRILSLLYGERRADALIPRSWEGEEPWKELFTCIDSIVVSVCGQRLNGYCGSLVVPAWELKS